MRVFIMAFAVTVAGLSLALGLVVPAALFTFLAIVAICEEDEG